MNITEENTQITQIPQHDEVSGLSITLQIINFLPKGLENFFKNLTLLEIHSSELKEIKEHDLAPFKSLRALFLSNNSIHLIERDTFKHNLYLEVIWLNQNGIKYIDPYVFDHLINLRSLNLAGSAYELGHAKSPIQVHTMILHIREIFTFPAVLWADNQELTTELHKSKILLEVSAFFNVFLLLVILIISVVLIAKKFWRRNRVGHDNSKMESVNTSKSSFLFELRDRLQSVNYN